MKSRWFLVLTALLAALALAVAVYALRDASRSSLNRTAVLQSMAYRLKERAILVEKLQLLSQSETWQSPVNAYLVLIRRDGLPAHAGLRQQLDALADNTAALATLVELYGPYARSQEYRTESARYLEFAHAWRDRWNSVFGIFMAGGNLPDSQVEFPEKFPEAVRKELDAG